MSTNTETTASASASTSTSTSTSTAGASASAAASADKSRLKKMEPPVIKRIEEQTEESPAPVCVLIVGMAGSGKTTLMKQLQESTMNDNDDDEEVEKEEEKVEGDNSANKDDDDDDDDDNNNDDDDNKKSSQNKKKNMPAYCINLDPACLDVPYSPSIDIRDTVDYKQVMSQHHLGPNGAIMTSLNLYATKFDQVINILEQRADENKLSEFLLVDTPGQVRPIFIPN
jgi:GTPase SAR1 family protein